MKYCLKESKEQELVNCSFVKSILLLLIILYHSIVFWNSDWFTENPNFHSNFLAVFSQWLNSFHIYTFTLISGYIFYYIKYEKGNYESFVSFFVNKTKRLLVPYLFTAIIWVIPIQMYYFKYDIYTVINKYCFATAPNQLWFLVMLFDVFIIFFSLSSFLKHYNLTGCIIIACLYAIGIVGDHFFQNFFMIWTACQHITFFWIGFKIRQYGSRIIFRIPAFIYIFIDMILFSIVQFILSLHSDRMLYKVLLYGLNLLLHIVGSLMAFYILQIIAHFFKRARIMLYIEKISMPMYLFHQQIIYFPIYLLNGVVHPYVNAIINFIFSISITLLISSILIRYKVTRTLIGEK